MLKTRLSIATAVCILFAAPLTASAYEVKTGNTITVSKDQVVEGNLYAAGQSVVIEGKVKGDVVCAGQTVTIDGEVYGSVICAGQVVSVNGKTKGSVRVAGSSVNTNGEAAQNIMAFGANVDMGDKAKAGWDMLVAAATANIRGEVGRDLHGAADTVNIFGKVGRNVNFELGGTADGKPNLVINDKAKIGGSVTYASKDEAEIISGAEVKGEITRKEPKYAVTKEAAALAWMRWKIYSIFAALIIGLVLISFWRKESEKTAELMLDKAGASIGYGLLILFITPLLAILLSVTLIGFPLAVILLAFWVIALMVSKILTGILIGISLLEKFWPKEKGSIIWAMIIGVIVVQIIISLPIIGWLAYLFAMLWGLGGVFLYFKKA